MSLRYAWLPRPRGVYTCLASTLYRVLTVDSVIMFPPLTTGLELGSVNSPETLLVRSPVLLSIRAHLRLTVFTKRSKGVNTMSKAF